MQVTLLAFAQAREYLGFSERLVTVPENASPASILDTLRPGWRDALPASRAAVDMEYTEWEHPLHNGQTVAILPPVSGG